MIFRKFSILLSAMLALPAASSLMAGNTGTTLLFRPQGETSTVSQGDYISTSLSPASQRYYAFFIEVPPSTSNLRIDIFDADVGSTSGGSAHDRTFNSFSQSCTYTVLNPAGTQVTSATRSNTGTTSNDANNAWQNIYNTSSPAAGHWEVRVDMGSGDDWNAYGLRAYDGVGNDDTDGVELNVYMQPFLNVGVNEGGDATYTFYPLINAQCSAKVHEFDYDEPNTGDSTPGTGDDNGYIRLTSRAANFTQTFYPLSNNNTWNPPSTHIVTGTPSWPGSLAVSEGFPASQSSQDYGIWTALIQIDDDVGNTSGQGNYAEVYITAGTSQPAAPTNQSVTGAYRIYFPRDGANGNTPGTAPVKPYVGQNYNVSSGPNPPVVGQTTRATVVINVENPTPHPITFSASRLVTASIPGLQVGVGTATYGGLVSASQGSVTSEPVVGLSGNIVWNPGTVAANSSANLIYYVNATPTSSSGAVRVTGSVSSGGTTAVYLDETGNASQARATFTYGPLCELALSTPTSGGVLLAEIVEFEAISRGLGTPVDIVWSTASEVGSAGFHLYRATNGAPGVRLTENVIVSEGSETDGATYVFTDMAEWIGTEPRGYFLEEVEFDGGRVLHGPIFESMDDPNSEILPISHSLAFAELTEDYWEAHFIDDFQSASLSTPEESLVFESETASSPYANGYYGSFENRDAFLPLDAGQYLLRAEIEWNRQESVNPPNARLRVFPVDFSTVWSTEIVHSHMRKADDPTTIETTWTSDGVSPWKIGIDLLGFIEGQSGGFRINKIEVIPVD